MIVDTHTHVVAGDANRYPLRPMPLDVGEWFREAPVTAEQLLAEMDTAGVDRGVLVQAYSAYGSDNAYVVDAARAHARRCVGVCIVDVDADAPSTLRALAAEGVGGVRLFAIGNPTLPRLDATEAMPVLETAVELGLQVIVTILPSQLAELRRVLDRFPDVPITLDHCGFPNLLGGPPFPEARPLFELAEFSNLHLKVSSHLLETAELVGDPRDLVDRLVAAFGADRLMWGSDFPQTHDRPYPALVELGRHACSRLPGDEQRAFLGDNALRLWPQLR